MYHIARSHHIADEPRVRLLLLFAGEVHAVLAPRPGARLLRRHQGAASLRVSHQRLHCARARRQLREYDCRFRFTL